MAAQVCVNCELITDDMLLSRVGLCGELHNMLEGDNRLTTMWSLRLVITCVLLTGQLYTGCTWQGGADAVNCKWFILCRHIMWKVDLILLLLWLFSSLKKKSVTVFTKRGLVAACGQHGETVKQGDIFTLRWRSAKSSYHRDKTVGVKPASTTRDLTSSSLKVSVV